MDYRNNFGLIDQEERQWAIREFKDGRKDVLVATDVASKGLDFPNIQHVINYDMPTDIENYGKSSEKRLRYCCYKQINGTCGHIVTVSLYDNKSRLLSSLDDEQQTK